MAVISQEQNNLTDDYPLLIQNHENEHFIDVDRSSIDASSSQSSDDFSHRESSSSPQVSTADSGQSSSSGSNAPGGRQRWNPFNTLLWILIELVFTAGQIIAAIIVLYISKGENPQNPLFAWVVGYAAGCAASLPLLYWRYLHRNHATSRRTNQVQQPISEGNAHQEPNSYITISFTPSPEEETHQPTSSNTLNGLNVAGSNVRLNMFVDHFKMALDCFFAVWFVVGNVWIFGDHSSSAAAPILYRLCIVYLTISCIGYAMPFILCGMICCCLPQIISILGIRDDMNQIRGASEDSINALPTHKFKRKIAEFKDLKELDLAVDEGGLVAAGTEKERAISGEDAVCCICLAKYTDDDLLRELPCTHFFHTECVDRWLKINATCPLCKFDISSSNGNPYSTEESHQQQV
ncbi:E3 ubiquitin-protein ligase At1g63170-like [Rutidosis leptorrhynchoides]|uniref:E3 ubiquitin-protein ligase At1g63170-like n=1 Tax=Rutidosis leptorrhynchoides TaxID=125765 RepID=UPI003A99ACE7